MATRPGAMRAIPVLRSSIPKEFWNTVEQIQDLKVAACRYIREKSVPNYLKWLEAAVACRDGIVHLRAYADRTPEFRSTYDVFEQLGPIVVDQALKAAPKLVSGKGLCVASVGEDNRPAVKSASN